MSRPFRTVPLIPGLVNEVALEIFLHFVAIDRDGASTLVLVCTAWRDMVLGSKFLQSLRRKRLRPNPALGENRDKVAEGVCIVSFDGGGPGSMSQLRMLEEFMARLAFKEKAEVGELLPADYFDLMGGVGFGGLVALLLGRLRMTTGQAMEELARIGTATFPESDEIVSPEVNIVRLRNALESMLERNGHSVEIKLRDSSENRCKVVLFAATTAVMDHCHPFRTYRSPRKSVDCTLVDAACATMATPDYFPSVAVGPWPRRQSFAGIPHNFQNPMREVLKEAKLVFSENNLVSLILSLGAGQPARHSSLDYQVTRRSHVHGDGVARDLQDQLRGVSEYLRLNVDKGMENIELDNWHELGSIETYTDVYLQMNQITGYIDRAVQLLLQRNGSATLGKLSGTSTDFGVKFHSESLEKYLAMEFKQMQDVIQELGIEKVTLVDAIGKHIPIPKHFCPTYAMLLDVIKVYFRHQKPPGSDLVERGDYRLLHGSGRSIVDPVEWDQLENVKLNVEMSMILRTRNNDKAKCPRCRTRSEAPPTSGWATCTSCSGQFQIEDQLLEHKVQSGDDSHDEEFHARENSIVTPAARESVQTSPGTSPIKVNEKIDKEGELMFRLISVVNLLDTLSNDSLASASLLSAPDRKKLRRSPQENGPALPTTPRLASLQLQPDNGRPPMQMGVFNGIPPHMPNPMMGGMFFAGIRNGPPAGGSGMPPVMAAQLRELTQAHSQHTQRAQGAMPSMLHPAGQHLQHGHKPRDPDQDPGIQMKPVYMQRPPAMQGPAGAPMGAMGQMGPMGQPPQRMPNGVFYGHNPNYRPRPGQQSPPGSAAHSAPGVNGQGPSGASYGTNLPGMNGIQPPPTTSGAMPGMPASNPSMFNPPLQHLQRKRKLDDPDRGPGIQMKPVYMQRHPGTQGPAGAPMGAMGQMGPMGQPPQRMPNGVFYGHNPNYRPQPGQQSLQQQQEMQTTGASGSPKQPGGPSTAQNSSPHLQGANGNAYDLSGMEQGTLRNQPSRGQKRPSPAELDYQYSKDASPPDRKKFKKSPQENGFALPITPSLAFAQPQPGNGRPPPMQTGSFNGRPPKKPNLMTGGMSFPTQVMTDGPPLGGQGMLPTMAGQPRELPQTPSQHTQRAQGATPRSTRQTDQQYLNQMQQTAITTYQINKPAYPPPQNPMLTGPPGVAAEPAVRGATIAPKGSMLPPPPLPFDPQMQMMGYQEDDPFTANMGLDFGANFGMDESYNNMSMYINDPSHDNGA